MALPEIRLDDRRFEDLVTEAKRRIPGYTPEWTDLNDSDPGMTLVQLFAWLAEMILWRLNRVPDKNFVKFLELIGIELRPATPARAELTFTLSTAGLGRAILVRKGTRVALAEPTGDVPVIFETDDNLSAVSARIEAVQSYDGAQYDLVTESRRLEQGFFHPFGERPQKGAALYLGLTEPFPPGRHTLTIQAYTADTDKAARAADETDQLPPLPVQAAWEYWAGEPRQWLPLAVVADTTVALTRTGQVAFEAPEPPNAMQVLAEGLGLLKRPEDPRLHWLRYRIAEMLGRGYEDVPRLENVLLNTVSATNAVTVNDELLGAGSGQPNQRFQLANKPVLARSLRLEVQEEPDGDFREWQEVPDFGRSGPDDRHYTLNLTTGEITFGDGRHGRIPPLLLEPRVNPPSGRPDTQITNIRARAYRWGGGAAGNAGKGKITSLESAIPFVDSVTNQRPAAGGQDAETLEEARARAPRTIRTRSRAVTAEDFEHLARETPGARIKRAKALPLRHPELEPARPAGAGQPATPIPVPGVITVVVVPESRDPRPLPREETLTLVARYLNKHRLVTAEVYVVPPRYRKIEVEARVIARPEADSGLVQKTLEERLLRYFHPLTGGDKGEGWEFGRTVFFSETYRQILTTDGVLRVETDAFTTLVDGVARTTEDVPLHPEELVWSERHRIDVRYE